VADSVAESQEIKSKNDQIKPSVRWLSSYPVAAKVNEETLKNISRAQAVEPEMNLMSVHQDHHLIK
jgi:hypothetical protein